MRQINSQLVRSATGSQIILGDYDSLGVANETIKGKVLSFLDDSRFVDAINSNACIKGAFVREQDAAQLSPGIEKIIVDDPKWYFFSIVNYLGRYRQRPPTSISAKAVVHSSATIAPQGVVIEDGAVVEAGAIILPDVTVCRGALIRAGAVLGGDGYEHKRTSRGILSVVHDGVVSVGQDAEIGVNTFVAKGFAYRPTIVGGESKIDALVHYAHGAQCGHRCFIVAHAMIGGNVTMGNDVWIGPTACIGNRLTIGDNAFITMGSVVTRDVPPGGKVTGNFAIPHSVFLRNLKNSVHD